MLYFECDEQCTEESSWQASVITENQELGSGVELALDSKGTPRFSFTLNDNIGLYRCVSPSCVGDQADWQLTKVEFASDLPRDSIILWPNCTVDAWVLHEPSVAITADGSAHVAYVATDLSGGVSTVDPTKPPCVAGKDMVLTRMTILPVAAFE
jgi:hypothetical protein